MTAIICRRLVIHWSLLCAIFLLMNNAYAIDAAKGKPPIIVIPIDKTLKQGEKVALSIKVPDNFRALETAEQFAKTGRVEFIPGSDRDPNAWTQIITIQSLPFRKKVLAKDLTELIKKKFLEADPNMKVMYESYGESNGYNLDKLAMSYTRGKVRGEMVVMEIYCGTQECASVQYAILLKPDKDKNAALKQMYNFLEVNKVIEIMKY